MLTRRRVLSGLIAAPAVLVLGQHMPIRVFKELYSFSDIISPLEEPLLTAVRDQLMRDIAAAAQMPYDMLFPKTASPEYLDRIMSHWMPDPPKVD